MENKEIMNAVELNEETLEEVAGGRSDKGRRVKAVSGDTYVRKHPDKDAPDFGVLYQGDSAPYLEEKRWDDRDVVWYKVNFHGRKGWVSSRYTKIVG
jgi:hypothetical protein